MSKYMNRGLMFYAVLAGIVLVMLYGSTVQAKKYYTLEEIGLEGCATDETDYAIISLRRNQVQYLKYKKSKENGKWHQTGEVKRAKLTPKTKYYMGNGGKLRNRSVDPDTSKWISRVRKSVVKREFTGRNNELQVKNGRVTKLVIRLVR